MKRMPLAVMLAVIVAMPSVGATPRFTESGLISNPNPTSKIYGGLTEILNPCGEPNPDLREQNGGNFNGLDGWWIKLPAGSAGRGARLLFNDGTAGNDISDVDMDAWFYNDVCSLITDEDDDNAYSMAKTPSTVGATGGPPEEGTIPAGAAYVIVNLILGQDTPFTFEVL